MKICYKVDTYSWGSFFSDIGGQLTIVHTAITTLSALFIFKNMNRFMAQRILIRQGKQPNEEEVNEVAKVFRHRVSLEGIYSLHETVNDNQRNVELSHRELEGIVDQQKDE